MNKSRKWWLLVVSVLPLVMSACAGTPDSPRIELPQQYRMPQANLVTTFERRSGRIALIDQTGNLVIMDQTGGAVVKITKDADGATSGQGGAAPPQNKLALTYQWPVWSPDASQVAFIEVMAQRPSTSRIIELGADAVMVQHGDQSITIVQSDSGSAARRAPGTTTVERQPSRVIIERNTGANSILSSSIYVAHSDGKSPLQEVYASDSNPVGYLDWSPDNSQIAFITRTGAEETTLNLVSKDAGKPRPILSGVSAAWNWRPDGKTLLAKIDKSTTDNTADLALLDAQAAKKISSISQDTALPFGSPAFSPDGNSMLLTVKSDGKDYLALADQQGKVVRQLTQISGPVSFSWSPSGAKVAYVVQDSSSNAISLSGASDSGGALHLLDVNTGQDKVLSQMPVAGFFWAPDGQRVAAFSPARASDITKDFPGIDLTSSQPNSVLMLQTIDVNTRAFRQLFYFEPTDDFSRMLSQFDRFSRSMNIWSPDSKSLVFPVIYTNSTAAYNLIVETEATGSIEPRVISQGTMAVWSPR